MIFDVIRTMRFGDCDPAGIAYFPRYFDMLNGVVEEWWTSIGLPWSDLMLERRLGVPTAHLDADFRAPARFGETLRFKLEIEKIGSRSLTLLHTVQRDMTVLWKATQVLVLTSLDDHRSLPWPEDIRRILVSFQEEPDA